MKEIDFIPEWYKTGQRKKISYYRQYALVTFLFVGLSAWSFIAGAITSRAEARVSAQSERLETAKPLTEHYASIKQEIEELRDRTRILERIRPKAEISSIIAELSHLVDEGIVLSSLSISNNQPGPDSVISRPEAVTVFPNTAQTKDVLPSPNTITSITINGIAAQASDVATLISRLEQSQYFCRIMPGYSRNKKVGKILATEFEIKCTVANFVETEQGQQK